MYRQQHGENNPLSGVDVGQKAKLCLVDTDNDGDKDLFIGNYDGKIHYFLNEGDSTNPVFVEQTGANNPLNGMDVGEGESADFEEYGVPVNRDAETGFSVLGKGPNQP